MKIKRIIPALILSLCMVTSLSACGGKQTLPAGTNSAQSPVASAEPSATSAPAEKVNLRIMTGFDTNLTGDYKLDTFQEVADDLGYKIEVERIAGDTYKTKIRVALQGNELPDVFYTWGASYSDPFLKAGALYPLEDAIAASGYKFHETYTQPREGHVYAVPNGPFESYGMFYNKNVLNKLNAKVPATWDELLSFVDLCKANNVAAIGIGDKARWEGDLLYNSFVMMEDTQAFKNAWEGTGSFTDEPFLNAAKKIETLVKKGAFQNGYMQHTSNEVLEMIKADQVALFFIGPWMISKMTADELGQKMGYTTLPRMSDKVDPTISSCTNAIDAGMAVSSNSPFAKDAAKFVVEYAKRVNDYAVANGVVPVMESADAVPPANLHEINVAYSKQMVDLKNTQLWWFSAVDAKFGEPMRDLSHRQFAGQISAEDFVAELQKIMKP